MATEPVITDEKGNAKEDPFITALQEKLMGQADMISSASTGIEEKISSAMSGVRQSQQASASRIESQFGREFGTAVQNASTRREGVMDARTGYATNNAFIRNLDLNTEKSLKDMDQRKQELLLAGEAAAAEKISDLQIKAIEFRQQAQQQAFANTLSIGQFNLNMQAEERAGTQFTQTMDFNKAQFQYTKESKMAEIATQFGITLEPTDTLDTLVTKASNSEYSKLNREKARLEIANLRKSLVDIKKEETSINLDSIMADGIAGKLLDANGKPIPAMSPEMAALAAANYMKELGLNPTREDVNRFREQATGLKSSYDVEKSKVVAEEQGKGFWSNFGGTFGQSTAIRAQGALNSGYTGADAFNMATGKPAAAGAGTRNGVDEYASFFNGLFAN